MVRYGRIPSWSFPNITHRLPDHYYKHIQELKNPSTRIYDRPPETDLINYKYDKQINRVRIIPDVPIPVIYPKEADSGIWGGEGIVKGYVKPRKYFQAGKPRPKYWFPDLKKVVIFSEILDTHFSIICTETTLKLIDEHHGFDYYILKTDIQDLKSQLALLLRRQMYLTLINKNFKSEEHEKEMLEKYGNFIIPLEEAEWFGLPVSKAITRYKCLWAKENIKKPMKYELTHKLIEELENKSKLEDDNSKSSFNLRWFDKIKDTFGRKKA